MDRHVYCAPTNQLGAIINNKFDHRVDELSDNVVIPMSHILVNYSQKNLLVNCTTLQPFKQQNALK
jgi:hypothetical protein